MFFTEVKLKFPSLLILHIFAYSLEFTENTWTPSEGNLMPVSVKLVMGLKFETRCGMKKVEGLPSGKYCLYKVQSAPACPENFTQGLHG